MITIAFTPDVTLWDIVNSVCGPHLHEIVVKSQTIINDDISSHRPQASFNVTASPVPLYSRSRRSQSWSMRCWMNHEKLLIGFLEKWGSVSSSDYGEVHAER